MSKLSPIRLEQHRPEMQVRKCGVHPGGTFDLLSHRTDGVGQSLWFVPNRAFGSLHWRLLLLRDADGVCSGRQRRRRVTTLIFICAPVQKRDGSLLELVRIHQHLPVASQ